MKKLIIGAVASLALLLGFASCSGDLKDSEVGALYLQGDFSSRMDGKDLVDTPRLKFDMVSDTEQRLKITYDKSLMTKWGGKDGTAYFKITRDADGWAKDWGGKKDTQVELSVNSQDWLELEGRDAVNSNPGNIVLKDLADGNKYILIAKYDAPSEKLSLKCVGAVTDYPILKAVIVNSENGKELTDSLGNEIILTRSGTDYTSEAFTPKNDGSISYYLTNGYLYWLEDGSMSTKEPDTPLTGSWSKGSEYVFFADAGEFAKNQKLVPDLAKSPVCPYFIIGAFNMAGSRMTLTDTAGVYTYSFTYLSGMSGDWGSPANGVAFKIQQQKGNWNTALSNANLKVDGDSYTFDTSKDLDKENCTISDLVDGTEYVITFTVEGAKFSVKVAKK